ncbi:MAG TPA: polysaccharide deacetylase family protein, partial [Roseiarcus sp.]|nr:polysaccharide deacetylase family protein [Roseiarcus sp.]
MKVAKRAPSAARARASRRRNLGPARDFYGYGPNPPDPKWPGGARIAVNINLNVEAGGEHCLLEGDARSEDALNDIGLQSYQGARSPVVESVFEYGPRSGCWRLLRIFKRFDVKVSILGVARALEQCPELTQAFIADGHEIVCHGYRWLDYLDIDEETEREHIRLGVEAIVIGFVRGRDHQMAAAADLDPERQFVAEIVAIIEEAAMLDQQPARVLARPAVEPADRRFAGQFPDRL